MAAKINHLIVLMLENRSFDHMLGFMRSASYKIDGLTGSEGNPVDPLHGSAQVLVSPTAQNVLANDPGHNYSDVNVQVYANPNGPPPSGIWNKGFVFNYSQQPHVTPALAPLVMAGFAPQKLPVLTRLAQEFAVCDRWFSSVPGPTWPNRFFAHCATSKGYLDNSAFHYYDMPTIFEKLSERGFTWNIYYHDVSQALALNRLRPYADHFVPFTDYARHAASGNLPNYAFIEPRFFSALRPANDQHPPHDVLGGEALIADVYSTLRVSSAWAQSLLLIVHDEHGGLYDHVLPPPATPPDGYTSQFAFNRYGVRVPAVLVSPYIARNTIVHDLYDHASIPATLREMFTLNGALTARDRSANSFLKIANLSISRSDTPARITAPAPPKKLMAKRTPARTATAGRTAAEPLSDLQRSLIDLANTLIAGVPATAALRVAAPITSEQAAARHVSAATKLYLSRPKAAAKKRTVSKNKRSRVAGRYK